VMTFARGSNPRQVDYHVGGSTMRRVDSARDLGVTLSTDFSFGTHVDSQCRKANSLLGFIVRASRERFSINALRTLYIHLVRPVLEYSSAVWTPHQMGHWKLLDGVQRRFLRLVGCRMGYDFKNVPISSLEEQLNLPSLRTRHQLLDLLFLRNLVRGEIVSPQLLAEVAFKSTSYTRARHLFTKHHCSREYTYHSGLHRLTRLGNELPEDIDFFHMGRDTFKRSVMNWLSDRAVCPLQNSAV